MPSEKIQQLLDMEASGRILSKEDQKRLAAYRYRTGKGKQTREACQQKYASQNKRLCISIPHSKMELLARTLGFQITGKNLSIYLVGLISDVER